MAGGSGCAPLSGSYGWGASRCTAELFAGRKGDLGRMMGLLLQVPELREPLKDIAGGTSPDGDKLARTESAPREDCEDVETDDPGSWWTRPLPGRPASAG